jgi:hypothetical protein
MGDKVLAEELLASAAVMTVSTQLRVVCHDTISNIEIHNPAPKCCNHTYSFMARDKGKLCSIISEISYMKSANWLT